SGHVGSGVDRVRNERLAAGQETRGAFQNRQRQIAEYADPSGKFSPGESLLRHFDLPRLPLLNKYQSCAAIPIEEYAPAMVPMMIANENRRMDGLPNTHNAAAASSTEMPVFTERVNVWRML